MRTVSATLIGGFVCLSVVALPRAQAPVLLPWGVRDRASGVATDAQTAAGARSEEVAGIRQGVHGNSAL